MVKSPATAPERDALRAAQEGVGSSLTAARSCAEAAARGRADLVKAQAAASLHDGLDDRITAHNADLLRSGASAGRAALPPDLVEARRARAVALEDVADALAVSELLDREAAAADAAALAAAGACKAAADRVMEADAVALAAEVRARDLEAGGLRALVIALSGIRTVSEPDLPWAVEELRHNDHHGLMLALAQPDWPVLSARWTAYRRALLQDADAVLPAAG